MRAVMNAALGTALLVGLGSYGVAGSQRAVPVADRSLQTLPLGADLRRDTGRFSLLGATWTDPRAALGASVTVRTRWLSGGWSAWQTLEADGPSGGTRGATDPLWVGPSDAVEARVSGAPPAGLRLDLIEPPAVRHTAYTARRAPAVSIPYRPIPAVIDRGEWGANEGLVQSGPQYTGDVQVLFVHHSAGTNNYSCSDSAAIVRSIQAYQVKSKHWNDIGYNFLVDKCGTLFEGRRGGITRPVLGAHTLGFNARSAAIAVLGDYRSTTVNARVRTVIAQIAAYKISASNHSPAGRATLTSSGSDRYPAGTRATLDRVSGHRDTGQTECPGDGLYSQLPAIRRLAAAPPTRFALTKINGATWDDGVWRAADKIRVFWTIDTATTLMNRYDVFLDGVLVTSKSPDLRQAALTLPRGRHTIRVRAIALNNTTRTVGTTVVVS